MLSMLNAAQGRRLLWTPEARPAGLPDERSLQVSAFQKSTGLSTCGMFRRGPLSSPDAEAAPRRIGAGVNPPIRLGGNSTIKGKGITVRKMACHVFKP